MQFKTKFVAFVDILGFSNIVAESEAGNGLSLSQIQVILEKLGNTDLKERIHKHGPQICPQSPCLESSLDYQVTQISDCVIVSAECSPIGLLHLVHHCWLSAFKMLHEGLLCRGYITRGSIFHAENQVIGTGYMSAFKNEPKVKFLSQSANDVGTPFIEFAPETVDFMRASGDACVQEMFSRLTKTHGDFTAIFPFKTLSHGFLIAGDFNPQKEHEANEGMRKSIRTIKERISKCPSSIDEKAKMKVSHYLAILDEQLLGCDKTDEVIEMLNSPFPVRAYTSFNN